MALRPNDQCNDMGIDKGAVTLHRKFRRFRSIMGFMKVLGIFEAYALLHFCTGKNA